MVFGFPGVLEMVRVWYFIEAGLLFIGTCERRTRWGIARGGRVVVVPGVGFGG